MNDVGEKCIECDAPVVGVEMVLVRRPVDGQRVCQRVMVCGAEHRYWRWADRPFAPLRSFHAARARLASDRPMAITGWPVDRIVDRSGATYTRVGAVDGERIREILRGGLAAFCFVSIGSAPFWVRGPEVFPTWKQEIAPSLLDPDAEWASDADDVRYVASEWQSTDEQIVVLFAVH